MRSFREWCLECLEGACLSFLVQISSFFSLAFPSSPKIPYEHFLRGNFQEDCKREWEMQNHKTQANQSEPPLSRGKFKTATQIHSLWAPLFLLQNVLRLFVPHFKGCHCCEHHHILLSNIIVGPLDHLQVEKNTSYGWLCFSYVVW